MSLTKQEKDILVMTAKLWNALLELPDQHPTANAENMRDIHDIQNRLMARVAKRAEPELFT